MTLATNPTMLTAHFALAEFGLTSATPQQVGAARVLCAEVLEPVHAQRGRLRVDCGYRPAARNAAVGGKPNSFHLYEDGRAAADVYPIDSNIADVFDWVRLVSGLPFDKLILEFHPVTDTKLIAMLASALNLPSLPPTKQVLGDPRFASLSPRCIHVQLDVDNAPRRLAYLGFTGNGEIYKAVTVLKAYPPEVQ